VPVKSFRQAKLRLAAVLDEDRRVLLARELAERVVAAARPAPTFVVCDDGEVADWAIDNGASVLYAPGLGLSPAVEAGVTYLSEHGFSLAVVAHSDLPLAENLAAFGEEGEITLAPDGRLDGTNVLAVPTTIGFHFSYGPRSFDRHLIEAQRLRVPYEVVRDVKLSTDIDVPGDLAVFVEGGSR